ncbi:MAG: DUF3592 domain-containing protein [Cyclobacteriaceae bacterium]|nr:DUF3592 domain-containing protein [Cyclobacteriaceae bacterium]MDW8331681.1 DUF3592 domain-containing protein [Cyclobacteriaceae bacterium]
MNINPDTKKAIIELLQEGRRHEAKIFVERQFGVSSEQAELLVQALENEIKQNHPQPAALQVNKVGCLIKILKILRFGAAVTTLILMLATVIAWYTANHFSGEAIRVKGRVIDMAHGSSGSSGLAPVIEYSYQGETKVYRSNVFSKPPAYRLNEEVTLLINPNDPNDVVLDSFMERYFTTFFLSFFTLFPLLLTVGLHIFIRKISKSVAR